MPADGLYWSPVDVDSEESNNFYKSYIDPWDLENYAYIRQQIDTWEPYSGVSSQPSGEQTDSTSAFIYLPGDGKYGSEFNSERTTSNYAAIEDVDIGIHSKYSTAALYASRNSNDLRKSSHEHNLPLTYFRDATGGSGKIISPQNTNKRTRSYSYSDGYEPVRSPRQIHVQLEEAEKNKEETASPIYDDIKVYSHSSRKFGLSRYGHLKIDYSYSWHNLHKYICN